MQIVSMILYVGIFVPPQVMLLVNRLKTKHIFVTHECALKIALTRSIFQPKMHQISFGGRAPPGPAGGAYSAPPDPLAVLALGGGGRH